MGKLILSVLIVCQSTLLFSQDLIVTKSGKTFDDCTIMNEDSLNVYFKFYKDGRRINTYISKDEIQTYEYGVNKKKIKDTDTLLATREKELGNIGMGVGYDYGGLGLNLLIYPHKNFGVFAGAGYALTDIGYNVGLKYRYLFSSVSLYVTGMYGTSDVVTILGAPRLSKMFYGPSAGLGIDFGPGNNFKRLGYFSLGLQVSSTTNKVNAYINDLTGTNNSEIKYTVSGVTISAGYRIMF